MATKPGFGILEVVGIGLVMLVFSLIGIAADFMFDLKLDMDGLLLISICLMMALVSAAMLFFLAKTQGWLGGKDKSSKSAPPASGGTHAAAQR